MIENKAYKKKIFYLVGALAGFINGLLGSSGGVILVTSLVLLLKIDDYKAHATAISVILPLTIISSFVYISAGISSINTSIFVALGSIIGAYIGSKNLSKLPKEFIRIIFGILMIVTAIGMMFKWFLF